MYREPNSYLQECLDAWDRKYCSLNQSAFLSFSGTHIIEKWFYVFTIVDSIVPVLDFLWVNSAVAVICTNILVSLCEFLCWFFFFFWLTFIVDKKKSAQKLKLVRSLVGFHRDGVLARNFNPEEEISSSNLASFRFH